MSLVDSIGKMTIFPLVSLGIPAIRRKISTCFGCSIVYSMTLSLKEPEKSLVFNFPDPTWKLGQDS